MSFFKANPKGLKVYSFILFFLSNLCLLPAFGQEKSNIKGKNALTPDSIAFYKTSSFSKLLKLDSVQKIMMYRSILTYESLILEGKKNGTYSFVLDSTLQHRRTQEIKQFLKNSQKVAFDSILSRQKQSIRPVNHSEDIDQKFRK